MIPALMPTYNRADLAFEAGSGAWLWTGDGRRFLDFGSGIATSSLGHGHPHLAAAIAEQAGHIIHSSNLYRVPGAEKLAARLVAATFADSVFFCNSGAEANEGMVKMMRRAAYETGHPERYRVLCFDGAFHGRTLAMLAATNNPKYLKGFGPVVDGFDHVPFNNLNAVRAAITPETVGILIEPVQGEGGVRPADLRFLSDLRTTCDEFGLSLGLDEVQCGMGRSGKLFSHEWAGIQPDIMSAAKGIAGGVPMGAILAKEHIAKYITPGSHGNHVWRRSAGMCCGQCRAGRGAGGRISGGRDRKARRLWHGLMALTHAEPDVFTGVRGAGLLLGLASAVSNTEVQEAFAAEGLLTITLERMSCGWRRRWWDRCGYRHGVADVGARCPPCSPGDRGNCGEMSGGALRAVRARMPCPLRATSWSCGTTDRQRCAAFLIWPSASSGRARRSDRWLGAPWR